MEALGEDGERAAAAGAAVHREREQQLGLGRLLVADARGERVEHDDAARAHRGAGGERLGDGAADAPPDDHALGRAQHRVQPVGERVDGQLRVVAPSRR